MPPTFHYRHRWQIQAAPAAIWPFIANSHRLNFEWGNAPLINLLPPGQRLPNGYHAVRASIVTYREEPFQWVKPQYHQGFRQFGRGQFFDTWRAVTAVAAQPQGGSTVTYEMWVTPGNPLGYIMAPLMLRYIFHWGVGRSLPRFDTVARTGQPSLLRLPPRPPTFAPAGRARLEALRPALLAQAATPALAEQLLTFLATADDLQVSRFRPYALADAWGQPRRPVLELCLLATRLSLLEFRWELLCPLCRGAKEQANTLSALPTRLHCETCNIQFDADFDRSVELLFNPAPALRPALEQRFCVGSPQLTPHIAVQQLLRPGERRAVNQVSLEPGRYRLRALELPGNQALEVAPEGATALALPLRAEGWPAADLTTGPQLTLTLENTTKDEQLFILERTAWSDQAVTAAEVTSLQVFRDLFAREALRPGEHIAVSSVAIVFTDLRDATQLYRQQGDAVAFGWVRQHFEVLREAIAMEDGAIVKTIGDAVMAVFTRPAPALRAILAAQRALATPTAGSPPLYLKAGLHFGPCIAVTLNERLDYFGSTTNLAARLENLCRTEGVGLVVSDVVRQDPEVAEFFAQHPEWQPEAFTTSVKGFEPEMLTLWRVRTSTD